jgi:hypothetical protein
LTGEPGESGVNWLNPIREAWMNFVLMVFDEKRGQYEHLLQLFMNLKRFKCLLQ